MQVTATEFKRNLGAYLKQSSTEVVYITSYGKTVAKLVGVGHPRSAIDELYGSVPNNTTLDEAKRKRAREKCGY